MTGQVIGARPRVGLNEAVKREILRDNPTAYWPLDETSGSRIADISGNGWDMTPFGAGATLASPGAVLLADGTRFLEITADSSGVSRSGTLGISTPFQSGWSACMLVRCNVSSVSHPFFVIGEPATDLEADNMQVYIIKSGSANALEILWEQGAGVNIGFTPVVAGRTASIHMFHIVKDHDALEIRTYIDGRAYFPDTFTTGQKLPTGGSNASTLIGGWNLSVGRHAIGHVAFFYDQLLTEARIHAHAMAAGRMLR